MDTDKPEFTQGLIKALRIVEFGILCTICCVPIITAGAATAAMFRMYFNMRNGNRVSFTMYFDEFGNVFKSATLIELIQLASGIFLGLMAFITLKASAISSAGVVMLVPVSLLFLIWILVFAYTYAHEAYYGKDAKTTIKCCFSMTFGCLLCTTALLVLYMILPMLYFLMPELFIAMLPIWIVLLIPLINWWNSYFYKKAFAGNDVEPTDDAESAESAEKDVTYE